MHDRLSSETIYALYLRLRLRLCPSASCLVHPERPVLPSCTQPQASHHVPTGPAWLSLHAAGASDDINADSHAPYFVSGGFRMNDSHLRCAIKFCREAIPHSAIHIHSAYTILPRTGIHMTLKSSTVRRVLATRVSEGGIFAASSTLPSFVEVDATARRGSTSLSSQVLHPLLPLRLAARGRDTTHTSGAEALVLPRYPSTRVLYVCGQAGIRAGDARAG
ncbi:hypothetical protein K438DRAFT_1954100 [Mycena galopus ATCC 62051]|nr:hypothetical protein K438DRAFT_1954100 [Mycena galopus ATCC 62051]